MRSLRQRVKVEFAAATWQGGKPHGQPTLHNKTRQGMNRQTSTIAAIALAVLVIAGIAYLWTANRAPETPAPVTGAERAEDARGVIAELEGGANVEGGANIEGGANVDYDQAFEQARQYQGAGRLADAQLLYFFGARGNHAPSAFALATMNDPNHHAPEASLLAEPDAFQAYKWYAVAREHGMTTAAEERLAALREWAESASQAGDAEAERLLLQWE